MPFRNRRRRVVGVVAQVHPFVASYSYLLCVNNARSLLRSPIRFCLYRLLHNSERTDGARDHQSVRVITVSYIKLSGLDSEGHLPVESILRLVIQLQCVSNSRVMGTENPNLVNTNTIQQCFPTGRGAQKSHYTNRSKTTVSQHEPVVK